MIQLLNIFVATFGTVIALFSVKKIVRSKSGVIDLCCVVFWLVQILPFFVELFASDIRVIRFEISDRFYNAMTDTSVAIVYDLYVIFTMLFFYYYSKNSKKGGLFNNIYIQNNVGLNSFWLSLIVLIIFLPLLFIVSKAPNPSIYTEFSYFYSHRDLDSLLYLYHSEVVGSFVHLSMFSILVFYFFNRKQNALSIIIVTIGIVFTTWIDGKRAVLMFLLIGILLIDYIKGKFQDKRYKKKSIIKAVCFSIIIIGYFYAYSNITGKGSTNDFFSEYSAYFSRLSTEKVAIYDKLYEDNISLVSTK